MSSTKKAESHQTLRTVTDDDSLTMTASPDVQYHQTNSTDPDVECPPSTPTYVSVHDLTLEEKLLLLSGQTLWLLPDLPRFNLPSLTVADGPHGVRKPVKELSLQEALPATCFPTAAALSCSWDVDLLRQVGIALGNECAHYQVAVLLGPGMNLKRHGGGGRNFEYFSEDPLVSAKLATAYVQGVQANGRVGACIKHFAVNNQESHRFVVDAVVDERTARELYYRGFEAVVRDAQPATIMCAYNKINGVYCSENEFLNTQLLRDEWGFQGVVMTDWGATNDRPAAIAAGMDLEMPGSHGAHGREIRRALREGTVLRMEHVDACAQRMLNLMCRYKESVRDTYELSSWHDQHKLAKQVAMQCAVLLQNQGNLLPLKQGTSVAVIGDFAKEHPRYQGMGSSQVCTNSVVTAYDELFRHTKDVFFAPGYHADDDHIEAVNEELLAEAVRVAQQAEVVLLCLGLPEIMESEGFDRLHLNIPAQHNALVDAVSKVNSNVIVMLSNGGAIEIPWADKVKAIFEGYLLGETGGAATVDLIFGVQSPCGKLAETFPIVQEDILADRYFPGSRDRVEYREGLDVGYRYFDTAQKDVRFPFGHGLTYTTFEYGNLNVQVNRDDATSKSVHVSFDLTNTGAVAAKEVVQCYIHQDSPSVYRPVHELKYFCKIHLEPQQSKQVEFDLLTDAFSFYDIGVSDWTVEAGGFEIRIASSSRDIRLEAPVVFAEGRGPSDLAKETYPPVAGGGTLSQVDDETFAKRFAKRKEFVLAECVASAESSTVSRVGGFHRNSLLKEVASRRLMGKLLLSVVLSAAAKEVKKGPTRKRQKRMVRANVENLPLRTLVLFSKGVLSFELLDACIAAMNYQVFRAIGGFGLAFACLFKRN
jgi:beta-glucosidase